MQRARLVKPGAFVYVVERSMVNKLFQGVVGRASGRKSFLGGQL